MKTRRKRREERDGREDGQEQSMCERDRGAIAKYINTYVGRVFFAMSRRSVRRRQRGPERAQRIVVDGLGHGGSGERRRSGKRGRGVTQRAKKSHKRLPQRNTHLAFCVVSCFLAAILCVGALHWSKVSRLHCRLPTPLQTPQTQLFFTRAKKLIGQALS